MTTKEAFDTVVNAMRKEGFDSDKILDTLSTLLGTTQKLDAFDASSQIFDKADEGKVFEAEKKALTEEEKIHKLKKLFLEMGVPYKLGGYRYLITGVILYEKNPFQSVTKEIYPMIADEYETTAARVERSMRHAIESAWKRADKEAMHNLFGNTILSDRRNPTNTEFLATCAEWLTR